MSTGGRPTGVTRSLRSCDRSRYCLGFAARALHFYPCVQNSVVASSAAGPGRSLTGLRGPPRSQMPVCATAALGTRGNRRALVTRARTAVAQQAGEVALSVGFAADVSTRGTASFSRCAMRYGGRGPRSDGGRARCRYPSPGLIGWREAPGRTLTFLLTWTDAIVADGGALSELTAREARGSADRRGNRRGHPRSLCSVGVRGGDIGPAFARGRSCRIFKTSTPKSP